MCDYSHSMGDGVQGHRPVEPASSRRVRHVTVVCVAGAGGPRLADELRRVSCAGATSVGLIILRPPEAFGPALIGDPLSGVFCPVDPIEEPRERATPPAVARSARQLQWFLWEMGIDARCEIRCGDPVAVLADAALHPDVDAVVFAASARRRWRVIVRNAARRVGGAGAEITCALDVRIGLWGRVRALAD